METETQMVTLSPMVMAILVSIATPLLAGLVTKLSASTGTKALVGVVFVALNAVVAWLVQVGGEFEFENFVLVVMVAFVGHVSTYYGFWKPVGGGNASPAMNATPDVGIGSGPAQYN